MTRAARLHGRVISRGKVGTMERGPLLWAQRGVKRQPHPGETRLWKKAKTSPRSSRSPRAVQSIPWGLGEHPQLPVPPKEQHSRSEGWTRPTQPRPTTTPAQSFQIHGELRKSQNAPHIPQKKNYVEYRLYGALYGHSSPREK